MLLKITDRPVIIAGPAKTKVKGLLILCQHFHYNPSVSGVYSSHINICCRPKMALQGVRKEGKFYLHIYKKCPGSAEVACPSPAPPVQSMQVRKRQQSWPWEHYKGVGGGVGNTFYPEKVTPNPQKPHTEATICKYRVYYKAESLNNRLVFVSRIIQISTPTVQPKIHISLQKMKTLGLASILV